MPEKPQQKPFYVPHQVILLTNEVLWELPHCIYSQELLKAHEWLLIFLEKAHMVLL